MPSYLSNKRARQSWVFQHAEVPQRVANAMASSFNQDVFLSAIQSFVIADNQSLGLIEHPAFQELIKAANPLAEQVLWKSRSTLRAHILTEYHAYITAVIEYLNSARSLIHISFDNWTISSGRYTLTGICVHHFNADGKVQDYLLGLPSLHWQQPKTEFCE